MLARGLQYAAQDRVGTAAIEVALGAGAATVMAVAILLSTFGCNNGLILSGPRVYYAMARDNLFFERAGTLHPDVPHAGVRAGGAGRLGQRAVHQRDLRAAARLRDLRRASSSTSSPPSRCSGSGGTRPDLPRPVKAFGYPVLPALYLVANAALMVILLFEKPLFTWPGLLIVATGHSGLPALAAARTVARLRRRGGRPSLDFPGTAPYTS